MRVLWRSPRFAIPTVLALAVSMGATLAVFTVVHSVLLSQLPLGRPEELVAVWSMRPDGAQYPFNIANYLDLRERNDVMQDMAAYGNLNMNLTGEANPERINGVRATGNFFGLMGVEAQIGRTLRPEDDQPGRTKVVVITARLWNRRYGASRDVLGKTIRLNGEPYEIVGVLPEGFAFRTAASEFAIPLSAATDPLRAVRKTVSYLRVFGRLKPGITAEGARGNLDAVAARLRTEYPDANAGIVGIAAVPLRDEITGGSRAMLLTLLGAVAAVLAIACANLSGLWIARAAAQRREMAIRAALGGTRWRLARQTLSEGLVLASLGAALGLLLANWLVPLLLAMSPTELPRAGEIHISWAVAAAAAGAAIVCGLLLGSLPALQNSPGGLNERGNAGSAARSRTRAGLVIAEVALSLALLTTAGVAMRSFHRLSTLDPGFRTDGLLTFRLALPATRYQNPAAVTRFRDELHGRIASIPGVSAAGAISILPLSGPTASTDFTIVGQPPVSQKEKPTTQYRMVDPEYFAAMQIPLARGRGVTELDNAAGASVAIVSEALAKLYWKARDPVGTHIRLEDNGGIPRDVEVVGVAAGVRELALDQPATPCLFVPIPQIPVGLTRFLTNNFFWAIRTRPGMSVADAVRREVAQVDGDVAAADSMMDAYMAKALAAERFSFRVLAIFAAAALLLAGGGLYALVSYATSQRRREIGIRIAMGASPAGVAGMVLRQGLLLAAAGVLLGAVVARFVNGDGATVGLAGLVMLLAAGFASWGPARRAARVDPVEALRGE